MLNSLEQRLLDSYQFCYEACVYIEVFRSDIGSDVTISNDEAKEHPLLPVEEDQLTGVEDILALHDTSEAGILSTLESRFKNKQTYTRLGSHVLLSMNPFEQNAVDQSSECIGNYMSCITHLGDHEKPHSFSQVAHAVRDLKDNKEDQLILISGESGSGKTAEVERILRFCSIKVVKFITGSLQLDDKGEIYLLSTDCKYTGNYYLAGGLPEDTEYKKVNKKNKKSNKGVAKKIAKFTKKAAKADGKTLPNREVKCILNEEARN